MDQNEHCRGKYTYMFRNTPLQLWDNIKHNCLYSLCDKGTPKSWRKILIFYRINHMHHFGLFGLKMFLKRDTWLSRCIFCCKKPHLHQNMFPYESVSMLEKEKVNVLSQILESPKLPGECSHGPPQTMTPKTGKRSTKNDRVSKNSTNKVGRGVQKNSLFSALPTSSRILLRK